MVSLAEAQTQEKFNKAVAFEHAKIAYHLVTEISKQYGEFLRSEKYGEHFDLIRLQDMLSNLKYAMGDLAIDLPEPLKSEDGCNIARVEQWLDQEPHYLCDIDGGTLKRKDLIRLRDWIDEVLKWDEGRAK